MLNATLENALNDQMNSELYSAHLYLSMAAHFESENLRGFANWMRVQHQEETSHALRIFDYINDRNGRAVVQSIDQPPTAEFESVLGVMEMTLEHERSRHRHDRAHGGGTYTGRRRPRRQRLRDRTCCWSGSSRSRSKRRKP